MATIYECDGCKVQERSHVWTADEGWHVPPGWLVGRAQELVCSEDCALAVGNHTMTPQARPRLQLVDGGS